VKTAIGVDLGGTNIKAGVVSASGEVVATTECPTLAAEGPDAVVGRMAKLVADLKPKAGSDVAGVGVGSPGPLNQLTGMLYFTPNMPGWDNYPLGANLAKKTGMKIVVDNDANVAALGEYQFGAGKGTRTMILLTLGTGIGGGVIIEGKVLNGPDVTAGEVGHIVINPDGPKCGCGNHGCMEAYCGTAGILSRAWTLLEKPNAVSMLRDWTGDDRLKLTPAMLTKAAEQGDGIAISVLRETGRLLGVGIASLTNLFAPDMVLLGGGISGAGEFIFRSVREEVEKRAMAPNNKRVKILPAKLGNTAGLVGAAALVLRA